MSNKIKLAILSSYNELCGNASYTKSLEENLKSSFDVEIISVNVSLLRSGSKKMQNAHLHNISQKLKSFDYVNIQFEGGLFGSTPSNIFRNFKIITKLNKNIIITMHRIDTPVSLFNIRKLAKEGIKRSLFNISKNLSNNLWSKLYKKVIYFAKKYNIPIIVHTPKDKDKIILSYSYDYVFDHPLVFYSQEFLENHKKLHSKEMFYKSLNISSNIVLIGIFGFINYYKNHILAINALKQLPENYCLLIGGSIHPHELPFKEGKSDYIEKLINHISSENLISRVIFSRFETEEEFLSAVINCDFNILPYLEVGQGGSAVAAISLETKSNCIFSFNLATIELSKYAPNAFPFISLNNKFELAQAISRYNSDKYLQGISEYINNYNPTTLTKLYLKLTKRKA